MTATLTTACFDLTKYHNKTRRIEDSIQNMKPLLEVPCFLVIYTDPICYPFIKFIRDSFYLNHLTKYHIVQLEDIPAFQYNTLVKENRNKYHPTKDERTCSESHLVCCSKFHFVLETIKENPFHTEKFGWIDAFLGDNFSKICHGYQGKELLAVLEKSYPDKFHIQVLNVNDKKYKEKQNKREYYEKYRWVVCGCLFITNRDLGEKILGRLNEIFIETTIAGYGHAEEMFYLEVLDEFDEDIERSYGDYGQILNNFIYPTQNLGYIYGCIISNYLNHGYNKETYDCCRKTIHSIEQLGVSCDAGLYLAILFAYYVSAYYCKGKERAFEIVSHIFEICNKNKEFREEYEKNKDFYLGQFKCVM
jgi:hypothetical protein